MRALAAAELIKSHPSRVATCLLPGPWTPWRISSAGAMQLGRAARRKEHWTPSGPGHSLLSRAKLGPDVRTSKPYASYPLSMYVVLKQFVPDDCGPQFFMRERCRILRDVPPVRTALGLETRLYRNLKFRAALKEMEDLLRANDAQLESSSFREYPKLAVVSFQSFTRAYLVNPEHAYQPDFGSEQLGVTVSTSIRF